MNAFFFSISKFFSLPIIKMQQKTVDESPKTLVVTFGRFNLPHKGHQKLFELVGNIKTSQFLDSSGNHLAEATANDRRIYTSRTHNQKNLLRYADKSAALRQIPSSGALFRDGSELYGRGMGTFFNIFSPHESGVLKEFGKKDSIVIVLGSDQVDGLGKRISDWLKKKQYFDTVIIASPTEREGMDTNPIRCSTCSHMLGLSGSAMRDHVKNFIEDRDSIGALARFRQKCPDGLTHDQQDAIFAAAIAGYLTGSHEVLDRLGCSGRSKTTSSCSECAGATGYQPTLEIDTIAPKKKNSFSFRSRKVKSMSSKKASTRRRSLRSHKRNSRTKRRSRSKKTSGTKRRSRRNRRIFKMQKNHLTDCVRAAEGQTVHASPCSSDKSVLLSNKTRVPSNCSLVNLPGQRQWREFRRDYMRAFSKKRVLEAQLSASKTKSETLLKALDKLTEISRVKPCDETCRIASRSAFEYSKAVEAVTNLKGNLQATELELQMTYEKIRDVSTLTNEELRNAVTCKKNKEDANEKKRLIKVKEISDVLIEQEKELAMDVRDRQRALRRERAASERLCAVRQRVQDSIKELGI